MKHDHRSSLNLLKTAKGQIEAVIRMTEEDRYCVDIANQIMAVEALLKKANLQILQQHIESCVRESFVDGTRDEKINEVLGILKKYVR
ncbi:MAG: metal-sensing transcriptional repressor [Acholeplasmataceae bacterium]|nr:metal-sensing transcriptional repressor [Acholeplasmataceae bacterium]